MDFGPSGALVNTSVILIHLFFLGLLFYYQKKEKIYIGYTTVLCLLFSTIIFVGILETLFWEPSPTRLLHLSLWVLGSVLIYVTSQLTLAFEKITKLSQAMGLQNINEDTLRDQKNVDSACLEKSENDQVAKPDQDQTDS